MFRVMVQLLLAEAPLSHTVQLVNSGTINVGTEQGKADGSNGEGLIGIKGKWFCNND